MTEFTITKAEVEALIREIEAPAVINRLIEEFGGVYEGWRRLQRPYLTPLLTRRRGIGVLP